MEAFVLSNEDIIDQIHMVVGVHFVFNLRSLFLKQKMKLCFLFIHVKVLFCLYFSTKALIFYAYAGSPQGSEECT